MERDELSKNNNKKRIIITSTILVVFLGLIVFLIVYYWDYVYGLITKDEAITKEIEALVEKAGPWAWLVLIFLIMLQVLFAVIPNGVFEMLAGIVYGPFLGVIIACVGISVGTLVVILLVKSFGRGFANLFVDLKDEEKYKFINDKKRCMFVMFGLLIIPGLPKDFLAFLVPFTKVKTWEYLILNIIGRLPTIIISVLFGDSLMNGNYSLTIILMCIGVVVGLICIIFNKQFSKLICKEKNEYIVVENEKK